jgi:2',3'-cyclic-nucleotide 2'-phosphodiesterase / 3'-nucleotidase
MKKLALLFSLLMIASLSFPAAETVTVQVLQTTDIHGFLLPWDYQTGKPAANGLAKLATIIEQERAKNPNTVLVDGGDTIQGSPLESVYQHYVAKSAWPLNLSGPKLDIDPMIAAMNQLGYVAMAVGNHEFNFGLNNLQAARKASKFPWLSANTLTVSNSKAVPFASSLLVKSGPIRILLIGTTTPAIPQWEKPEHYAGYRWESQVAAIQRVITQEKKRLKPDAIIVMSHSGLERDLTTGKSISAAEENEVYAIAEKCVGVDAILFSHTHQEVADKQLNGVALLQAKNWAASLGKLNLVFERVGKGWKLIEKSTSLIKPTKETPIDARLVSLAQPYHDVTERYLQTAVAQNAMESEGRIARFEDSVITDAVHEVQLHYSGADVSFTAPFNARARLPKGQITVRELATLYPYENELYAIEGTGKMVREALEVAARFLQTCRDAACAAPLINPNIPAFNFDIAQGVSYEIDLSQPQGMRIKNLRYQGQPLTDQQPLKIAINNYRYGGSGGYSMFVGSKVIYRSQRDLPSLLIEYYTKKGRLPERPDQNWKIVPAAALATLKQP